MRRKYLHMALGMLLGLSVLAGCRRAPLAGEDPLRITEGPVRVSLTLSIQGFGENTLLTKADYVDLESGLCYDYENNFVDYKVLAFDASDAFENDGSGKFKLKPSDAELLAVEDLFAEKLGSSECRIEFKINDPIPSLAVLVLANYGSYPAVSSGTLASVIADLQAAKVTFTPDQAKILSGEIGVPMHGLQVFGTWEGMSVSASDEEKQAATLKYYKNMSTPLTRTGFNTATELANYTGTTGAVRKEDHLVMRHAVARLHVRYEPKTGQPAGLPLVPGQPCVEIESVKMKNYQKQMLALPKKFNPDIQMTPFAAPALDSLSHAGVWQGSGDADIVFAQRPSGDSDDYSWIAYVPEQIVATDPSDPVPYLIVKIKVTDKDGKVVHYTYEQDKITREWKYMDPVTSTEKDGTGTYYYSPWTEWLQMQNIDVNRKYAGTTTPVPIGTYYHLVRNYAYEWIAEGVEGMTL